jgi:hypothetical protein
MADQDEIEKALLELKEELRKQMATRAAEPGRADGEFSGASWASKFADPETHSTADLDSGFAKNVDDFIAAMEAAGIVVHIKSTRRSAERAYLLHWSWEISYNKISAEDADQDNSRPADVNIRWAHTKKGADGKDVLDPEASFNGATELFHTLGGDPKLMAPPALHSRHILGKAIDMTTTWTADSIEITDHAGNKVKIEAKDGPKNGLNTKLWAVGDSFGVRHFGEPSVSAAAHDGNHWSDNSH